MHQSVKQKLVLLVGLLGVAIHASAELVVRTAEPQPYEPFTIELNVNHLKPPHGYIFVEVENNVILIGHKNIGLHFTVEPRMPSIEATVQGIPPGSYTFKIVEMPGGDEEPYVRETGTVLNIPEVAPAQPVYALFHTGIQHYFVTASYDELLSIAHDDDWKIVDFGFNAWPADGPAPAAALPVCRFYSYEVNSHFYTADPAECTDLRETQSAWQYEGIAFRALVPMSNACPTGTKPVWRLYNNRHQERDSNHRFVASSETYRAMIASGWLGEGVAFCSPTVTD